MTITAFLIVLFFGRNIKYPAMKKIPVIIVRIFLQRRIKAQYRDRVMRIM